MKLNSGKIKLAVILGSGLNVILDSLKNVEVIHEESSGFHIKKYVTAYIDGEDILFLSGRRHFYEGYSKEEITDNVKFVQAAGVKYLLTTNAAGGINPNFNVSDLMLFKSHYLMNSKLTFDKSVSCYNSEFKDLILKSAEGLKIKLHHGVYCCAQGPTYETNAEIRLHKKMLVDAVGMSTVPEVFEANRLGIKTAAISVITNLLKENSTEITDHSIVVEASQKASGNLLNLIKRLSKELK